MFGFKKIGVVSMRKTSNSQTKANQNWCEKNKDLKKMYSVRSNAKRYIREYGTKKNLLELQELINIKLNELEIKKETN